MKKYGMRKHDDCPSCKEPQYLDFHHWSYGPGDSAVDSLSGEAGVHICRICHNYIHGGRWSPNSVRTGTRTVTVDEQQNWARKWRKHGVGFQGWRDLAFANTSDLYFRLYNTPINESDDQETLMDIIDRYMIPDEFCSRLETIVAFVDRYLEWREQGENHKFATVHASKEFL